MASAQLSEGNVPRPRDVLFGVELWRAYVEEEGRLVALDGSAEIVDFAGVVRVAGVLHQGAKELLFRAGLAGRIAAGTSGADFGEVPFEGGGVLERIVGEDDHDHRVRPILDHLEGPGQRHPRAGPGDDALFTVKAQAHVKGLAVADLHDCVVLLGDEELGELELLQRAHSRNVVTHFGVHADHLDPGVLALEEASVARDCSAGPEARHEVRDLALRLAPDLRPGRENVSFEVRLVLVLVGHVKLGLGAQLDGARDGPLRGPRGRSEVVVQLFDV